MNEELIPLSVPCLEGNEAKYVEECIRTGWISSAGAFVHRFETELCKVTGASHSVAVVNGTAALHLALRAVGVGPDSEVIVPSLTFIASVNAISYCGARPIFMDCDEFYNLDIAKTLEFLSSETESRKEGIFNKATGRRISAILPVHVFGNAVDIAPLKHKADELGIPIVEDAAESLGSRYRAEYGTGAVHTGLVGTVGCLSFNGNKLLSTGGGGAVLTNDSRVAEKVRYWSTQAKDDEVHYLHHDIGYNYRLTNVHAAIGVAQLEQLSDFLLRKKKGYARYRSGLSDVPGLSIAATPPYAVNNHWMHCLQIDADLYGEGRDQLLRRLHARKIQARPVWHLNHLQRPYAHCQSYRIERAPRFVEKTLNIPCSVNLTEVQIDRVIEALRDGESGSVRS